MIDDRHYTVQIKFEFGKADLDIAMSKKATDKDYKMLVENIGEMVLSCARDQFEEDTTSKFVQIKNNGIK